MFLKINTGVTVFRSLEYLQVLSVPIPDPHSSITLATTVPKYMKKPINHVPCHVIRSEDEHVPTCVELYYYYLPLHLWNT